MLKERGKRKKEKERYREKSCGVKIYIFVTNKSLILRRVLNYLIKCKKRSKVKEIKEERKKKKVEENEKKKETQTKGKEKRKK